MKKSRNRELLEESKRAVRSFDSVYSFMLGYKLSQGNSFGFIIPGVKRDELMLIRDQLITLKGSRAARVRRDEDA